MTEAKRVPELRFKADDGSEFPEWEERRLGKLIKSGGAGGTPVATDSSMYNGPIPFLGISDMTEQGKYLTYASKSLTQKGLDNSAAWVVPSGHLIYAMYASVGKVSINRISLATSQAMFSMKLDDSYADQEYVYYILDRFREHGLKKFITTGTQGNVNAETLRTFPIPLPSLPEQKKIAEFFSLLDERISKQADKVARLQEYKKGISQRIFSRELRFKDENGEDYPEWEEKKLGEVAEVRSNGVNLNQSIDQLGKPVTRIETISTGRIDMKKVGYVPAEIDKDKHLLKVNDILFSNINSIDHIGKTALVDNSIGELYHGMNLVLIRSMHGNNGVFLYHLLNSNDVREFFKKVANKAVSQASINRTTITSSQFAVPSLPEQEKIAALLSTMDSKIAKEEEKLAALREQKRGLMQRMFI